MGDLRLRQPTLRFGQQRSGPSLGVGQLRLDPQIEAEIRALRSGPPSPRLRHLVLRPNWARMDCAWLDQRIATLHIPPAAPAPLVPRGRGPATPRPGEVSDLLRAVWGIPTVQNGVNRVLDQAAHRAQRDWNRLSTGQQIALVTQGALIAGGALAGAMSNPESRAFLLNLIIDQDIPVPGVDGLQFRILERGGQASFSNIGGSGISARAGGSIGNLGEFQGEVRLTLDLTRWVPILR